MWYIQLLEELATSPKSPFKQETVFFIKELLNEIQLDLLDGEDFEIEFIMGFFSDVFYCVERYKKHHMPLAQFARICMGLAILHIKKSEDAVDFCCSDFLGVLNNEKIYEIMDLDHQISSFVLMSYTNFKEGKLIYKPMGSLTARDVDENLLYRNQLIYLILTDMLKKLEFKSFASLNYNVTVDFDRFLAILNQLLNQVTNPYFLLQDLYTHLVVVKNNSQDISQQFWELADAIRREIIKRDKSQLKLSSPDYSLVSVKKRHRGKSTLLSDDSSDERLDDDNLEIGMNEKITLMILPKIEMLATSSSIELLNFIRSQLQNYIQPVSRKFSLFGSACRNHQLQVGNILYQMDKGLSNAESILNELHQIKITHPKDKLIKIINSIEKKHHVERTDNDESISYASSSSSY